MATVAPDLRSFPRFACSLRATSQCLSHLFLFIFQIWYLNVRALSAENNKREFVFNLF